MSEPNSAWSRCGYLNGKLIWRCRLCDGLVETMDEDPPTDECSYCVMAGGEVQELRDGLLATLLFHSGGMWGESKRDRWLELTGRGEATTKALCDRLREILAGEPKPDAGK